MKGSQLINTPKQGSVMFPLPLFLPLIVYLVPTGGTQGSKFKVRGSRQDPTPTASFFRRISSLVTPLL
ncbi:MAG: hypothetical protein JRI41_08245 [Deltaproteobacteria bacterium]|nr:hypothetical protein [Deltaproteobacteria bacterium]